MLKRRITSLNTAVLLSLIIVFFFFYASPTGFIAWDGFGQYCYLPLVFIEHTFHVPLSYFGELNDTYQFSSTLYQFNIFNDFASTKYTLGVALLSTPFFLLGHLFAYFLDYPMDGYSLPYSIAFGVSITFYAILSVFLLRKLLLHFFAEKNVIWLLIILFLGTNIFVNINLDRALTHTFAFTFLTLLILRTIKFHENPTLKNGIWLGLALGILGLIRLPDLIFGLIPVFWSLKEYGSFPKKIRFLITQKALSTAAVFVTFILFIGLQLFYWKRISGDWFIDSYANNPGEGLDWLHPHTIPFLVSFKKGWLIYTPVGIMALIGIIKSILKGGNYRVLAISFLLFLYTVSAWTSWWYASSFSQRAMIDVYPLIAIAIGLLLTHSKWRKWILTFSTLFICLNLFQSFQYEKRILSRAQMTKEYYFSTFGQMTKPTEQQKSLLEPDFMEFLEIPFEEMNVVPLKEWSFDLQNGKLDENNWYSENIFIDFPELYQPQHLYLIKSEWHYNPSTFNGCEGIIVATAMNYKEKDYNWKGTELGDPKFELDTVKGVIRSEFLLPNLRTKADKVRTHLWRNGDRNIEFDKVDIKLYEVLGRKESF